MKQKNFPLPYAENKISGAHKTHCSVQPFWGLYRGGQPACKKVDGRVGKGGGGVEKNRVAQMATWRISKWLPLHSNHGIHS